MSNVLIIVTHMKYPTYSFTSILQESKCNRDVWSRIQENIATMKKTKTPIYLNNEPYWYTCYIYDVFPECRVDKIEVVCENILMYIRD
jgi:hypothetical protein